MNKIGETHGNILMTREQVLDYVGIKRSTMYHWMKKGTFPMPIKMGERLARWQKKDLDAWFKNKEKEQKKNG